MEVLGSDFTDDAMGEWLATRPWHCVLDVVDSMGALTLQETGDLLEITRERTRQIEGKALQLLVLAAPRQLGTHLGLGEDDVSALKARLRAQRSAARREAREHGRLLAHMAEAIGVVAKHRMILEPATKTKLAHMLRGRYAIYGITWDDMGCVGDVVHLVLGVLRNRHESETASAPTTSQEDGAL